MANIVRQAWEFLRGRRRAYQLTFAGQYGEEVLRDLAGFCRAHRTCVAPDEKATWVAEGRREVWLRIQHHLQMSEDELWRLYDGRPLQ